MLERQIVLRLLDHEPAGECFEVGLVLRHACLGTGQAQHVREIAGVHHDQPVVDVDEADVLVAEIQERVEAAVVLATEHGFPIWIALGNVFGGWARSWQAQNQHKAMESADLSLIQCAPPSIQTLLIFPRG